MSYLLGIVILAAYSGTITSYLTVQRHKLPIETFEDLLNDNTYTFHSLAGAEAEYFQVSL